MFVAVVDIADLAEEQFECLGHIVEIDFLTHLDFICVYSGFLSEQFS